ncbi:MAG: diguanylate cyclase [Acidobacteriota bacterium]
MRALIADSDPDRLRQLEGWLTKWGYEVGPAGNGVEAWNRLSTEASPTLVILAWKMDAMHGIDVCRRLRLQPGLPSAYVLLIADDRGTDDLLDGLNAGADDFLFMPLDAVEVRARVRTGARIVEVEEALRASQDALRIQSTRDAVTGSWNHATILDLLQKERERARRKSGSVGVVLADLDEFRKVNENLGHPVGDEVLREAARRMSSSVRPYDAVGRYGGEEFLIVLPGSDGLGALTVAERIREAFAKRPVDTSAGPVPLTLSLGVAAEGGEAVTDSASLLQAADSALKRAQNTGRNRAALSDNSGVTIDAVPPEEPQT